jgi:hypothetical protein
MKRIGLFAMLGLLAMPGMAKAGVCVDQFCRDRAFVKFESTVYKANGVLLNNVNKAFAFYVVNGDATKTEAMLTKANAKLLNSVDKARASFFAKTGFSITGADVTLFVLLPDQFDFSWAIGNAGSFGY